jgi:hypothetical protein
MQQLLLLLIAAIVSSCSSLQSLPYEEPKAAVVESGDNTFSVRFRGSRPHVCTLIDQSGAEAWNFLATRDGERIDLDFFPAGEYKIVIRQGAEIVCVKQIRLK